MFPLQHGNEQCREAANVQNAERLRPWQAMRATYLQQKKTEYRNDIANGNGSKSSRYERPRVKQHEQCRSQQVSTATRLDELVNMEAGVTADESVVTSMVTLCHWPIFLVSCPSLEPVIEQCWTVTAVMLALKQIKKMMDTWIQEFDNESNVGDSEECAPFVVLIYQCTKTVLADCSTLGVPDD